ncbi:MAG TPA: histidine kinase dimerization/phospho-acceptor domain-containing protein [Candidatus Binatia bacterium]|jgi:C4-dicarboxylate-specific signal transduction histidine kinase
MSGSTGEHADDVGESDEVAALRAIAAGFAHEIGNPLAGVAGRLQLIKRRTREDETRESLSDAHAELARIAQGLRELIEFTRPDDETTAVDVNEVLRAALTIGRYAHSHAEVDVSFEPDPHAGLVVGRRHQLLEAFLRLTMSAYETMNGSPGRLRVGSERSCGEIVVVFEHSGPGVGEATRRSVHLPARGANAF